TQGVLRAGVETGAMTFEASVFRGEEPDQDDNRYNIETPRLDSWAARVGWHRGPWQAQFSGGRLHEPEWFEPYDQTRLTASISFATSDPIVGDASASARTPPSIACRPTCRNSSTARDRSTSSCAGVLNVLRRLMCIRTLENPKVDSLSQVSGLASEL